MDTSVGKRFSGIWIELKFVIKSLRLLRHFIEAEIWKEKPFYIESKFGVFSEIVNKF